jgi:enamine deaminase RidA (YjgF/YER057c/UK114 family)
VPFFYVRTSDARVFSGASPVAIPEPVEFSILCGTGPRDQRRLTHESIMRTRMNSKQFFAMQRRWPSCVAAGPFLFVSGQMGRRRRDGRPCAGYEDLEWIAPGPGSEYGWVSGMEAPLGAQALAMYSRYRTLLAREGAELGNLLRYHVYQRDKRFFPVFDRVRRHYETAPPASTAVGVGRFDPEDEARLCMDAIAFRPAAGPAFGARTVLGGSVRHAAAAHFSHVIGVGPYLFLAGQIPIDTSQPGAPLIRGYGDVPEEGRFLRVGRSHEDARNGPIAAQTWFTYDLIRKHLEGAGASLEQVLNLVVYLQDMRDFPTFHRVHEHFFPKDPPALTVIEVDEVGHKGTLIEIEPTAVLPGRGVKRRRLNAAGWKAPAQMSMLVEAGGLAFLSGIAGNESVSAARGPGREAIARQLREILGELRTRLALANADLRRVVHVTIYLDDIAALGVAAPILERAFGRHRPALTVLEVPRPAPVARARVQLTAIAWLGEGDPIAASG